MTNICSETAVAPRVSTGGDYMDCLVELIETAEVTTGELDEHPDLKWAMDRHVILGAPNGDIGMKCGQCDVMCTIKSIGENAIALFHNRDDCKQKQSN